MSSRYRFPKHIWIIISGLASHFSEASALDLDIIGCQLPPIQIDPEKSTGLDGIFVVNSLDNVKLRYKTEKPQNIKVAYYSNLGAAYAIPVDSFTYDGEYLIIENLLGDVGYVFTTDESSEFFWIVDYSKHIYRPAELKISDTSGCDETILDFEGSASQIVYYTINGRQQTLSRDLELSYISLSFDEELHQFVEKEYVKNIAYINEKISLIPPVTCKTNFVLKGDRFLSFWGDEETVDYNFNSPVAVVVRTEAIEEDKGEDTSDVSNQITSTSDGLGGSAPATISFISYVSDAVIHNEWQMANDESFEDIIYRFNQQDLTYTFTSEGTVFVRFVGSNADGSCEAYGDTYEVSIGSSELLVPNAFSPNGDGVNDEWKVSYKSLLDFECWIFDRQGHQLFYFNDPKIGWDGSHNGRPVSPGVYYYVITAKGSDGRKYKRSGDINILKSSGQFTTSEPQ